MDPEENPYDEGYDAFDQAATADDNPYNHDSDESMEWARGWTDNLHDSNC